MDTARFEDMSGERPFCKGCPDHEACGQGYPCWVVVLIDFESRQR